MQAALLEARVRKCTVLRRFVLEMIILPRKARDKHRESSTQKESWVVLQAVAKERRSLVRKRHFFRHLYIKCIILPRQARDDHRENSKKVPFSRRCEHTKHAHRTLPRAVLCPAAGGVLMPVTHQLPRQARDKHRETQPTGVLLCVCRPQAESMMVTAVCENGSFEPFVDKCDILPRQARDKHGENSKKTTIFSGHS
jgi:hypothetical protein